MQRKAEEAGQNHDLSSQDNNQKAILPGVCPKDCPDMTFYLSIGS